MNNLKKVSEIYFDIECKAPVFLLENDELWIPIVTFNNSSYPEVYIKWTKKEKNERINTNNE